MQEDCCWHTKSLLDWRILPCTVNPYTLPCKVTGETSILRTQPTTPTFLPLQLDQKALELATRLEFQRAQPSQALLELYNLGPDIDVGIPYEKCRSSSHNPSLASQQIIRNSSLDG